MKTIYELLTEYSCPLKPQFDERIYRFKIGNSKKADGWMISKRVFFSGKAVEIVIIGDWKTGRRTPWSSRQRFSKEDKPMYLKALKEMKETQEKETLNRHLECKEKNLLWHKGLKPGPGPVSYMMKKGISPTKYGVSEMLLSCEKENRLVIPMQDMSGSTWNYQSIIDGKGKLFRSGRAKGLFHRIEGDKSLGVYLCEGFATGITIRRLTGGEVIVCFSASNLETVGNLLATAGVKCIVCADNDAFNEVNTGVKAAQALSERFSFEMRVPRFENQSDGESDFNDLEINRGATIAKEQLMEPQEVEKSKTVATDQKQNQEIVEIDTFIRKLFEGAKKCLITKTLQMTDGSPILNDVGYCKGQLKYAGLKANSAQDLMERWEKLAEPELLIDRVQWNGQDNIGHLFSFIEFKGGLEEMVHAESLIKEWMVKAYKKIEDTSIQNVCPIFLGPQGVGKDTFFDNLFSGFGRYYKQMSVSEKEIENYQVMSSKIILNIAEFDRTARMSSSMLKNMITTNNQTFRAAYGRKPIDVEFRCSFISTCNTAHMLNDKTGNRRFWVFNVKKIKWEYPIDKEIGKQVFAQIEHLVKQNYQATKAAKDYMDRIVSSFSPQSEEVHLLNIISCFQEKCREFARETSLNEYIIERDGNRGLTIPPSSKIISEISKEMGGGIHRNTHSLHLAKLGFQVKNFGKTTRGFWFDGPIFDAALKDLEKED